ncbi:SDR family oxidoreductase [Tessaracoccus sp. MC1865]|uniref:SDR family NAD(P)-dependent oxidoreductase n=1 Tax=Tessaracoccus sp. MC1865 TaxID=2760310 RepID=UPI001600524B|nr:SDR family oxidoreductase [Tessaracoccus sp. MC1865]MBB1482916.1 SDR family oxidoreductase [Tessaracoccus sp. MC1865]QTO37645.1 SDR family oxidoreductase [Tessaracoccus sp. MC1865]
MTGLDLGASLKGRVVVVTGAAGAIGSKVALALDEAGVRVLAVDLPGRTPPHLRSGAPASYDLVDVGGHEDLFEHARALGEVVGLVHTAAIIRRSAVDEVTEEDFDTQVAVNLKATYFLNRQAWRTMRSVGRGSIVNYVSQGWMSGGYQGSIVYAATKGAVTSMTRGFARSFAPDGVRVNAVSPGYVDTEMLREGVSPEDRQRLVDEVPLGRLADPDDLVGATVFLLSDAASYITGAVINVSGGQLMY